MSISLKSYAEFVEKTATVRQPFVYAALGVAGESGELVEHVKKAVRDNDGFKRLKENEDEVKSEIGDVFWYLTRFSNEMGFTLEEVLDYNMKKLLDRRKNGKKIG